jgi:hypothetical protein
MSFTYDFNSSPQVSTVRLLIMDTDSTAPIFEDVEITQFLQITSSQGIYQSSQSNPTGNFIAAPVQVYSYYQAAALGLQAMASNKAYLSSVSKILDVSLDPSKATKALMDMAKAYLDRDDNSGAFAIAEWVNDQFSARERVYKQFLRLYGS